MICVFCASYFMLKVESACESDNRTLMYGLVNVIKGKNDSCKSPDISAVLFLICQVICYSVIEETARVIGKSPSTRGRVSKDRQGGKEMVMEMRVRRINGTHRAYLLQRQQKQEVDKEGIHLNGKCDSYSHIVLSCSLSCYTNVGNSH